MTISASDNRESYAGNGVTVDFAFPNKFLANADLVVLLVNDTTDVSVLQVLTTNYTVTGAGADAGGTVTMVVAPPSGYTLVIYSDPAVSQLTDLVDNGPMPAQSFENALDKLTLIARRLKDRLDRSLSLADSDNSTSATLPTPEADKLLGWNDTATALTNKVIADLSTSVISAFAATLLDDANAAAARVTLGAAAGPGTDTFRVNDATDATKQFAMNLSAIATGQTRTASMPNYNITLGNIPAGAVMDYAGSSVPTGWLECDGSAVSRTTYADLFASISTTWGAGDGSTTFNLPPSAGRSRIGKGTGTVVETFLSSAINTSDDGISVASNNFKWLTGMEVVLSSPNGAPGGLSHLGTYYIIRSDATTIRLASSLANAQNGSFINITTQGTSPHTITHTLVAATLGETGGEQRHAMSITELLAHTHNAGAVNSMTSGANSMRNDTAGNIPTSSTGGNEAMNNMQPFGVYMQIIKH